MKQEKNKDTSNLSDKIRPKGKILDFPLDKAHLLLRGGKVINVKDVKHHLKAFLDDLKKYLDNSKIKAGNYYWLNEELDILKKKHFGGLAE